VEKVGDVLANSLLAVMAASGVYILVSALILKRINIFIPSFGRLVAEIAIVEIIAIWGIVRLAGNIRQAVKNLGENVLNAVEGSQNAILLLRRH
jgi:hypothetical protein